MNGEESILWVQEWSLVIFAVIVALWLAWTLFRPRTFSLDFDEYIEDHPDLCEFIPVCNTWSQSICHHALNQACPKRDKFEEANHS